MNKVKTSLSALKILISTKQINTNKIVTAKISDRLQVVKLLPLKTLMTSCD